MEFSSTGRVETTHCTRCGCVVATLKNRGGREVLVPWSHYKALVVELTDGSIASIPMCADCNQSVKPVEFPLLTKKLKFEWMREQMIAYQGKPDCRQKVVAAGQMCKNKQILRRI